MVCGIEGQYRFGLTVGDYEDFLKDDKFIQFILIENIGLSLPYWELKFDCVFPELLQYFNEKSNILVQIGTSINDLKPLTLTIKKPIVVPQSSGCSSVTLRGFTSMHSYLEDEKVGVFEDKTSWDLAQAKATEYELQFKSNIEATNDKMTYYQPRYTDYKFLFTEWLHSYYADNDIIIPAITTNGFLTYNSLSKQIVESDPEKLTAFANNHPEKNEIQVDANQGMDSNMTMSNAFGNYVKDRYIFDVETGTSKQVKIENNVPIISESKSTSTAENISSSSGFFIQSSNVHPKYYEQELVNRQKFFSVQSSRQWVSATENLVLDTSAGDLAMYMNRKQNGQVDDSTSGMYLVSKRVISIKNRSANTNFLLTRENVNYSK